LRVARQAARNTREVSRITLLLHSASGAIDFRLGLVADDLRGA
jgi:hypothetical protein